MRGVFCYAPYMNNQEKEYIDQKFDEAEQTRKAESALVQDAMKQRKTKLLKIFSVYAVIMLIAIAVVAYYFIRDLL